MNDGWVYERVMQKSNANKANPALRNSNRIQRTAQQHENMDEKP
jgi:hypothetical protein